MYFRADPSFSAAFAKLLELGVPTSQLEKEPWTIKTVEEQSSK